MAKKRIATFLAPNKGLSIAGDHAYAASGAIQNAGTAGPDTTLLDFTTGNYVFVGMLDFTNTARLGHDVYLNVTFNGIVISSTEENSTGIVPMRFDYLIPPLTTVTVKWGSNATYDGSAFMVGRVYDA